MSYDKNECTFSGKVSDIRRINTKTETPMSSFRLMCRREQIRCVGSCNVKKSKNDNLGKEDNHEQ